MKNFGLDTRIGAAMAIKSGKRYLICERQHCRDFNGLFQFPGGEVSLEKEIPREAAVREAIEETGVYPEWDMISYVGVYFTDVPRAYVVYFFLWELKHPRHNYPFRQTEPDKHGAWLWVTLDELLKLPIMSGMAEVLKQIKEAESEKAAKTP